MEKKIKKKASNKITLICFIGSVISFIASIIVFVFFTMVTVASESFPPFLFGLVISGILLVIGSVLMFLATKNK